MSDPLYQIIHYLNSSLTDLDVGLEVDVEAAIPVRLTTGPLEHETDLRVRITEEGWELVDPEVQTRRIEEEIRERFQELKPDDE